METATSQSPGLEVLEASTSASPLSTLQSPDTVDNPRRLPTAVPLGPQILPLLASITVQHLVPPMARTPSPPVYTKSRLPTVTPKARPLA